MSVFDFKRMVGLGVAFASLLTVTAFSVAVADSPSPTECAATVQFNDLDVTATEAPECLSEITTVALSGVDSVEATVFQSEDGEALENDARQLIRQGLAKPGTSGSDLARELDQASFVDGLRDKLSKRFAGAWISEDKAVHVRLTGKADAETSGLGKSLAFTVVVEYGATTTMVDKIALVDSKAWANWRLAAPEGVIGVSVSEREDALVLHVMTSHAATIEKQVNSGTLPGLADLLSELTKAHMTVIVEPEKTQSYPVDQNRGGRHMDGCTSGFVYSIGGVKHLVNARHCAKNSTPQTYFFFNALNTPYATTFVGKRYDAYADLQWRTPVTHSGAGTFYADTTTGDGRIPTGQANATVGQSLCHRGRTTGYSCGQVVAITFAPTGGGYTCGTEPVPCAASYVTVQNAQNAGGDSGGPWFLGTTAIGIHKGNAGSLSFFSKLSYLPSGMTITKG